MVFRLQRLGLAFGLTEVSSFAGSFRWLWLLEREEPPLPLLRKPYIQNKLGCQCTLAEQRIKT